MSLTLKLALSPLLVVQAVLTRARLPRLPEAGGDRAGIVGAAAAPPLRLLIAGDSSAAGVGVDTQEQALAKPLAAIVAQAASRRVSWTLHARTGLSTAATHALLRDAALEAADVAVIVTGVNDVIELVPSHRAVTAREALANWLRNGAGVQHVVYAPLPPVHQFPGLPQPLRFIAGTDARRHNDALAAWSRTRADVSCVDLSSVVLHRRDMARDGFHPGEPVYRACAEAIGRHVAARVVPLLEEA